MTSLNSISSTLPGSPTQSSRPSLLESPQGSAQDTFEVVSSVTFDQPVSMAQLAKVMSRCPEGQIVFDFSLLPGVTIENR